MNRRKFLTAAGITSAAAGTGAFALSRLLDWRNDPVLSQAVAPLPVQPVAPTLGAAETPAPAPTPGRASGSGVLVAVFLGGGNDGLRTVIPVGDGRYRDLRPELASVADAALPLSDGLALHAALPTLHSMWSDGHVAVVGNVGYDKPNRSHFASTDIWMSCDPSGSTQTGWVGRWLDDLAGASHDPLRALAIGSEVPLYMRGARTSAAAVQGAEQRPVALLTGDAGRTVAAFAGTPGLPGSLADVAAVNRDLLSVRSVLATKLSTDGAGAGAGDGAAAGAGYGSQFAEQMATVAQLISSGLPTRVYGTFLGGFDTHATEATEHDELLADLDAGIAALYSGLERSPYKDQVTTVTFSEFGRRVAENGSGGTDHGAGSQLFVIGAPVRGGIYGGAPDLVDLDDNGDLKAAVDFRSVFAELTESVLGGDPAESVGKGLTPIAFLL